MQKRRHKHNARSNTAKHGKISKIAAKSQNAGKIAHVRHINKGKYNGRSRKAPSNKSAKARIKPQEIMRAAHKIPPLPSQPPLKKNHNILPTEPPLKAKRNFEHLKEHVLSGKKGNARQSNEKINLSGKTAKTEEKPVPTNPPAKPDKPDTEMDAEKMDMEKSQKPVPSEPPPKNPDASAQNAPKMLKNADAAKPPAQNPAPFNLRIKQKFKQIDFKAGETCESYTISADNVPAAVRIFFPHNDYVPTYELDYAKIPTATHAVLNSIREELITMVNLSTKEFVDPTAIAEVKVKFSAKAEELVKKYLPGISETDEKILVGNLIHEMLGLGVIELILADNNLEEIVINNSSEPVWVYHKKRGWLKTTIIPSNEDAIYNYSSSIGRRVGRQITNLYPLMDAHLSTGDRVNATLFPISTKGNTITIRRFARSPWTIINMIDPKVGTLSIEVAALLWLAIHYELNILIVGGTASGKTSFLNTLMPFIPPNQRIISIEDTREISLPKFLQWVPFSSREPNPEGKGGVTMLDLLINSLRMRPDRIIVGEIRRSKEVEVMFEAIRTGHSAYATFHADRADQAYKRLINPPIDLPESMLSALHLLVVQYRHRRLGIRRTIEVAEIVPTGTTENRLNVIYRWDPKPDRLESCGKIFRTYNEINLYTGMNDEEIKANLKDREAVLSWMLKHNIKDIHAVGKIFAEYYKNEKEVIDAARRDADPSEILGSVANGAENS